jgi:hypothetical protein
MYPPMLSDTYSRPGQSGLSVRTHFVSRVCNRRYWNQNLGLLWTPNLEHSRLTKMWSAYDALTNSFAVEGIRVMVEASSRQDPSAAAQRAAWSSFRYRILGGLHSSLGYQGEETDGAPIYAEMLGHVNNVGWPDGAEPYPLIWGMSWVQTAVINTLISNMSTAGGTGPGTHTHTRTHAHTHTHAHT